VRSQRRETIQNQCGILQLLDINHPVSIDKIYVDVNILEEIASQQWFEIADLQKLKPTEFDRFGLGEVEQKQIPGMRAVETYSKLRVLGKPGVGKTTFSGLPHSLKSPLNLSRICLLSLLRSWTYRKTGSFVN
jgi:predicted NACHT family NTPase